MSVGASRTARVTSPEAIRPAASVIDRALFSTSACGSYSSRAAKPSVIPLVGTTRTRLSVRASTCSATGTMFLLLGRITTSSAGTASTDSSSSAVEGFIDCPPATIW